MSLVGKLWVCAMVESVGGKWFFLIFMERRHFSTTVVSGVDNARAAFALVDRKVVGR